MTILTILYLFLFSPDTVEVTQEKKNIPGDRKACLEFLEKNHHEERIIRRFIDRDGRYGFYVCGDDAQHE